MKKITVFSVFLGFLIFLGCQVEKDSSDDIKVNLEFEKKIILENPLDHDFLGYSLDFDGVTAIVGAPRLYNSGEITYGSAYIYNVIDTKLEFKTKIFDPSPLIGYGKFGYSVSVHGTRVIIGAPERQEPAPSPDEGLGKAYVFNLDENLSSWNLEIELSGSADSNDDDFGKVVAINENYVAVSSSRNILDSGLVTVYRRSGTTWSDPIYLTVPQEYFAALEYFGSSLSFNGEKLLVGASGDGVGDLHSGEAWLYDLSDLNPNDTVIRLAPTDDASTVRKFGSSVALSDNWAVIGAAGAYSTGNLVVGPSLYIFEFNGSEWIEKKKFDYINYDESYSGLKVSFSDDKFIASGCSSSVYLFDINDLEEPPVKIVPSIESVFALTSFPTGLVLKGDTIFAGAGYDRVDGKTGAGSFYMFDLRAN